MPKVNDPKDYLKFSDQRWDYAFGQHPMYMIILEDSKCAEREPPWGERTIERYIKRIDQALASLDKFPELIFNLDMSAVELLDLSKRSPSTLARMRKKVEAGRIEVHNGTYSQPHMYLYGSASCLRQLELGNQIIQRLLGVKPVLFAAQEPSITYQLPQILKALGYRFAVAPAFVYRLETLGRSEILVYHRGFYHMEPIHGKQWFNLKGLDGTRMPIYVAAQGDADYESIQFEYQKDTFGTDNLKLLYHDLRPMTPRWIKQQTRFANFVGLEDALAKRFDQSPPETDALLHPCWGYADGVDGYVLKRIGFKAEQKLLSLHALAAYANLTGGGRYRSYDPFWEVILTSQHHDVNHPPVPEWRPKCVARLHAAMDEMDQEAQSIVSKLIGGQGKQGGNGEVHLALFNGTCSTPSPVQRFTVPAAVGNSDKLGFCQPNGRSLRCDVLPPWAGEHLSDSPTATGYLDKTGSPLGLTLLKTQLQSSIAPTPLPAKDRNVFENDHFRVRFGPEGTIDSLHDKVTNRELIDRRRGEGNQISGRALNGRQVHMKTSPTKAHLLRGQVVTVLRSECRIGRNRAHLEMVFHHRLPRIDMRVSFDFENTSFGKFQIDSSKLCNHWHLAIDKSVHHDVPFGHLETRQGVPVFASSWIDVGDAQSGLMYLHHGTPKLIVAEGCLSNVWAWGKKGPDYTTRCHTEWPKDYDLRLNGRHIYAYSVVIRSGALRQFSSAQVARQVLSTTGSYVATAPHLPATPEAPVKLPRNVVCAELVPGAAGAEARIYEAAGRSTGALSVTKQCQKADLRHLDGRRLEKLSPFQIARLKLKR
jgi:hypothetical protein